MLPACRSFLCLGHLLVFLENLSIEIYCFLFTPIIANKATTAFLKVTSNATIPALATCTVLQASIPLLFSLGQLLNLPSNFSVLPIPIDYNQIFEAQLPSSLLSLAQIEDWKSQASLVIVNLLPQISYPSPSHQRTLLHGIRLLVSPSNSGLEFIMLVTFLIVQFQSIATPCTWAEQHADHSM